MMSRILVTLCPRNVTNVTLVTCVRVLSLVTCRPETESEEGGECREPGPDTRNTGDTEQRKYRAERYRVGQLIRDQGSGAMQLVTT